MPEIYFISFFLYALYVYFVIIRLKKANTKFIEIYLFYILLCIFCTFNALMFNLKCMSYRLYRIIIGLWATLQKIIIFLGTHKGYKIQKP